MIIHNCETKGRIIVDSDECLARDCKSGNKSAFEELDSRYRLKIFALARRKLWSFEDAEEVTQIVMTRAVTKIYQYDGVRPFRTWIAAIAVNCIKDSLRKRGRYRALLDELHTEPSKFESPDPTNLIETREEVKMLLACFSRLSLICRQLLGGKYLNYPIDDNVKTSPGWPQGDNAERIKRHRCLKELREMYGKSNTEPQ